MATNIYFSKKKFNFLFLTKIFLFRVFSISISPNLCSNLKTWWSLTYRVPTLICVGKHNICVGNREIILIGNRNIKQPQICHDFKTANFNSREFKWGYSIPTIVAASGLLSAVSGATLLPSKKYILHHTYSTIPYHTMLNNTVSYWTIHMIHTITNHTIHHNVLYGILYRDISGVSKITLNI